MKKLFLSLFSILVIICFGGCTSTNQNVSLSEQTAISLITPAMEELGEKISPLISDMENIDAPYDNQTMVKVSFSVDDRKLIAKLVASNNNPNAYEVFSISDAEKSLMYYYFPSADDFSRRKGMAVTLYDYNSNEKIASYPDRSTSTFTPSPESTVIPSPIPTPTPAPASTPSPTPTPDSEMTEEEYKAACTVGYDYKTLARDPKPYIGKKAMFRGQVIQVMEDSGITVLRVNVNQDEYGYWEDTMYVIYVPDIDEPRILEDDIITMYGEMMDLMTYETVIGTSVTIPQLYASYIDIE